MKIPNGLRAILLLVVCLASHDSIRGASDDDELPSWQPGPARTAIIEFVERVTTAGSPDFVPVPERIATFDNDGTLWCEQPAYVQAIFMIDRVKLLAPEHPDWKNTEPFKSVLAGKFDSLNSEQALARLVAATHSGMSVDAFAEIVNNWLATARHPRFDRPYTECVYQPMLELLAFLRAHEFKTFIVSGGGVEFMRPWTERVYGIPPEQVVGSRGKLKFELQDGVPIILKLPEIALIDDGPGKPVGIQQQIGRQPIAAFGNSDGDLQMLQWSTAGEGARFGLIVHHTDAEREYAYDRDSHIGRLDKALDAAQQHGWTVVSMRTDWKSIFPPSK